MSEVSQAEKFSFQAEVKQVLNLMVHSLYSNREIFLRELVSNASDACDKLRFEALANDSLYDGDSELKIRIELDKDKRTIHISDNGIGMNRDEVIENIGTIARSGTKRFLEAMAEDKKNDSQLIGQFGVGFYSAFIVADKVTMITRKAGDKAEQGTQWVSDGQGEYTLETVSKEGRGTEVILHLKADADEFLEAYKLRSLITRYSDHISFPIQMLKEVFSGEEEDKEKEPSLEWETVNDGKALWTMSRTEISDDEYQAFYKHLSHDFGNALTWSHNHVEGNQSYTSLLYIPENAPFDMTLNRDERQGLKLYVKRVFIMDAAEQMLPAYLRFMRGLIDSQDLPLNVSREILQENSLVKSIRSAIVKRTLDMLTKLAKKDSEKYAKFWSAFGEVLKEGVVEDFSNREKIAKLLRFASTHNADDQRTVSLDDYISRMKEGQEKIFFITADSENAARHSPHLEFFNKQGIEVLLMSDRVDEWMMGNFNEYDGKTLQSIAKGDLNLDDLEDKDQKDKREKQSEQSKDLLEKIKSILGDKVEDVRVSARLTDSPSCLVLAEQDMAIHMQKLLKQAGHEMPGSKPVLEINPENAVIKFIDEHKSDDEFSEYAEMLFEQALLSDGGQLDDPAGFVKRMNKLLIKMA